MTKTKEDAYIRLLRMAREDLSSLKGIELNEFNTRVKSVGLKDGLMLDLYRDIYNPVHPQTLGMPEGGNFIRLEAYMKLLEYDELKHSLEESKQARKEAKWAIWISIAAIVAQIIFR